MAVGSDQSTGSTVRILGIDPGSRKTGYGLIEQRGSRLIHIDNGAIFTEGAANFPERLTLIARGLNEILTRYQPQAVAIEDVFVALNPQSALKLGQARGAAIVTVTLAGLPVAEYTAMQVKQAVVGQGRATKQQVQQMVRALLALPEIAQEDASDALAVAICHANSHTLTNRLQGVIPRVSKRARSWRNYQP